MLMTGVKVVTAFALCIAVPKGSAQHILQGEFSSSKSDSQIDESVQRSLTCKTGTDGLLPNLLLAPAPGEGFSTWSIRAIIEIARIDQIAFSGDDAVAFIVEKPILGASEVRYALYELDTVSAGRVRKLCESTYMDDLQHRPGTRDWTVRGDFGRGIQLGSISADGQVRALIRDAPQAVMGGYSELRTATTLPHPGDIYSYEWSDDGSKLWYSRPVIKSASEISKQEHSGTVYDDKTMLGASSIQWSNRGLLKGLALHVVDISSKVDKIVAFDSFNPSTAGTFALQYGTARWTRGHLRYKKVSDSDTGFYKLQSFDYDPISGTTARVTESSYSDAIVLLPKGILVRSKDQRGLDELRDDGHLVRQFKLDGIRIDAMTRAIVTSSGDIIVAGVHFRDRDGIIKLTQDGQVKSIGPQDQSLKACSISGTGRTAVCSSESVTTAPTLVEVDLGTGAARRLVAINESETSIVPLRIEKMNWKNKFDQTSDGYLIYPRNFEAGKRYPMIVVTHANGARNEFVDEDFQWNYPLQVFAEHGYFVACVNEPVDRHGVNTEVSPEENQKMWGLEPVATMSAAAEDLIQRGYVDSRRVGIAGYSRGAVVTRLSMALDKHFSAGSSGDSELYDVGYFWIGLAGIRQQGHAMFGGAITDPANYQRYLNFSPSARASKFSGPLLQQSSQATADSFVEMDQLLRDSNVPTELVFYPNESHIFVDPAHRAAAMELNLDWFNYWLLNIRSDSEEKREQYKRWDEMRRVWKEKGSAAVQLSNGNTK